MANEIFSRRLKELREKQQLSMEQLGKDLGVTKSRVNMWENSGTVPRSDVLVNLAKYFNVSTDYLLRPNSPAVNTIYPKEFEEVLGDCSPDEVESIVKVAKEIKSSLRKAKNN